jgi:regulation of enolase protein 1 (concanavalin A-like superfamily)
MQNPLPLSKSDKTGLGLLRKTCCMLLPILLVFGALGMQAQTRYVSTAGADVGDCSLPGSPCLTITYAIGQGVAGDVIVVAAGTYNGPVTINKELTLNGANAANSGCGTRSAESVLQGSFTIGANNVTIAGFEVTGTGAQIRSSVGSTTWSNVSILNNYIHVTTAQQAILHGFGQGGGIGTANWTISNNKIEDIQATDATSIALFNITGLTMADNCITHANTSFDGRRGVNLDGCQNVVFDGNTVDMGLVSPASDNSDGAFTKARYQLQLSASFQSVLNVTVSENILEGAYDGIITLGNGIYDGITITRNTISNNVIGIRFQAGTNVPTGTHSNFTITNNDISTSNRCIYLQDGTSGGGTADTYSGIAINNNSLVRSTAGVALELQSTALTSGGPFNATCNWYGSSDQAVVATRVSGALITVPFLTDGTDNDGAAPGFQPVAGSCNGAPVRVYSDLAETMLVNGYSTIQAAVSDVTTLDGYVVRVDAGTYNETVTSNKSLSFVGAGCGQTIWRGNTITSRSLLIVRNNSTPADVHVEISGFSFETENNQSIRADWSAGYTEALTLDIHDNCFKHVNTRNPGTDFALYVDGANQTARGAQGAIRVYDNLFDVVTSGLLFEYSRAVDVLDNTFNVTYEAVAFNYYGNTGISGDQLVSGNVFNHIPVDWALAINNWHGEGIYTVLPSVVSNNFFTDTGFSYAILYGVQASQTQPHQYNINENSILSGTITMWGDFANQATLDATCNWWGSVAPMDIQARVSGNVLFVPFLTNGTDNEPATMGFQPVPGSCTGCLGDPTVSFDIGGSSVASINNSEADPSESATVAVCDGGTYTLANMVHSSGTSRYMISVTPSGGGLLFNGSPAGNGDISAAQFTAAQGIYTVTLSNPAVGGTVVQVITPYNDVDNSGSFNTGDCAGDPITITYTVNPQPRLVAELNGVSVTNDNDGIADTGAFEVCDGGDISITTAFSDLAGATNVRVFQTVAGTNASIGFCNNCQALLSDFTAGTSTTATLTDPTLPGTVVITFQAWGDTNNDGVIDADECIGDVIEYTITVNPAPSISFTAQVTDRAAQNGNSATPTNVVLDFCAGESFNYSNYVSVPGANVGVLEELTGTGNVTYNGAPVSVPRAQIDFGVGGTTGYFNGGPYGPYGLSSGATGQFVETFTPYYDADGSGTYTPGDCLGNPVTITYNVYALPDAIATPPSQTICTNSATDIALSSNVPGTTFSWIVQSTTGMVTGQSAGNGTTIAQTLINSGATDATVTYRITPTGPGPNNCAGPTTDVTVTVSPSPTITCPNPFSVNSSADGTGNCSGTANWTHPTLATGPCGTGTLTMSIDGGDPVPVTPGGAASEVLNIGPHTVTYVFSDENTPTPNTSTCSFTVTVVDDESPVVVCYDQTVIINGENMILLDEADLMDADDNCDVATTTISPTGISCEQVGQTVPIAVTVTDVNGNPATCNGNITVTGMPCGWSQNPNGVNCANGNDIKYDTGTGVWTATSTNCFYGPPFTSDAAAFAQRTLCGDGSITAQVTSISGTALGWAGVMMRENNDAGAKKAQLTTNLSNFSRREFRTTTNGSAFPQQFPSQNRYWLRLVRAGNQFSMYVSPNGFAWYFAGAQNVPMNSCIQVGLVATNYQQNSTVTATFANVSFTGSNVPMGGGIAEATPAAWIEAPHSFEVYPNPTSGELNLELTQYAGRAVRLEVYNLTGQLLRFTEIDEVQTTLERLDLSGFSNGMYLIRVKSDGLPDATQRVAVTR